MWVSDLSGAEWFWLLPLICLGFMLLCFFGRGRRGRLCCGHISSRGEYRSERRSPEKRR
jgi:hypothetical protein